MGALEADGVDDDAPNTLSGCTIDGEGATNPGRSAAALTGAAANFPGDETASDIGCVVGGSDGVASAPSVVAEADGGIDTSGTVGITSVSRMGGAIAAAPSSRGEGRGGLPPDSDDGGAIPEECGRDDSMETLSSLDKTDFLEGGQFFRVGKVEEKLDYGFQCTLTS